MLYWNYQRCYEEAKKYSCKIEFSKNNHSAYQKAVKNGWINDYDWFVRPTVWNKKWDYNTCYTEAKKYVYSIDFLNLSSSAYEIARKNNWIKDYVWLNRGNKKHVAHNGNKLGRPKKNFSYEQCYNEAIKYKYKTQFRRKSYTIYMFAKDKDWLNSFTWLINKKPHNYKWDYDACEREAKKHTLLIDFLKNSKSAYNAAIKNDWIKNYTWLKRGFELYKDKVDCVYVYEFRDKNTAYIGRTLMQLKSHRHYAHMSEKDSIYKFAKTNNIDIPDPIYLEENLLLEEGVKKECFYIEKYKKEGWILLNKNKGGGIGKLGWKKWSYKKCYNEALKYNTLCEFIKNAGGAYLKSMKEGWISDYIWLERYKVNKKPYKWDRDSCFKEAQKYSVYGDFAKQSQGAYLAAYKNKWLDDYTWLYRKRKKKK